MSYRPRATNLAELPRRGGRVWAALDAHQIPYWGRGKSERFEKGWSGNQSRRLRGYRLFLAVDADTGQIIIYALARGGARDDHAILLARPAARPATPTSYRGSTAPSASLPDPKLPDLR